MRSITAEHVEALSGIYLSPRYDDPKPTPDFHREAWELYCSPTPAVALAAPRGHAKSTSLTHDFILANVLFQVESYIIIVGASEEMAVEQLNDIKTELEENDELIAHFKIKGFIKNSTSDIIVEFEDGEQFRILARGAEQKIRGRKWRGRRPGLIVCDDLEDDEQVESKDRRRKFRKWFFRACKPALRAGGRIRVHGTILHVDALLARLMKNKTWKTKLYKAHRSYSDYTGILWPEQYNEARLRAIQKEFEAEGDSAGYSQEYLNDPKDDADSYLNAGQFRPMSPPDHESFKKYYAGGDFAVSKQDMANRTSFTIGGVDLDNFLHIVDQRVDRWDTGEWIDEMFAVQLRWNLEAFFVEGGVIWLSVWPMIQKEMRKRNIWINFIVRNPIKDKATRGRPYQKRMKAGSVKFDTEAAWFSGLKEEQLDFTGVTEAVLDDQFDSAAILAAGLEEEPEVENDDQWTEEEVDEMVQSARLRGGSGRNKVTGY